MGIGKRIRDRRVELKMSSAELASRIHVTRQTISGYELERTFPNPEKLREIVRELDCDANYLYQDFIDADVMRRERNGLTETEFELIRMYRMLNDHGKFVVESIAKIEYGRMLDGLEKKSKEKNEGNE